ncbi:MAG TPA: S8 family serine peptidase, partial [Ilumatobacteraceae bacterium]
MELAFLDAYAAGVFVSASAGNDGPGAGTANHLSAWTTSVAASTQTREFRSHLTVTAPGGATYEVDGVSIGSGSGATPLPVVLSSAAPYSRPLCDAPAPAGTFTGKIVACQRGVNARVEKGFNVFQGGALGMILYNLPPTTDVETDNHWLPTVHLANGQQLVSFVNANPGATAQFTAGTPADGQGDVMASFSSRGPAGPYIKPDITAPGVQILAGHTPTPESNLEGPPGEHFQAIAVTSMSSPHIAGSAVLLKALHPDWTPMEIRSAMMLTAKTSVVKENGTTPADPFDMGAGRVDLTVAGNPGLVMDESADNMVALAASAATGVHLNQPSINAPVMPGRVVTTRTFRNVTPRAQRYRVETTAPAGSSISVSPSDITIGESTSTTVTITIVSTAPTAQYFGEIRLVPITKGAGAATKALHLPVAFVPQQGGVSLVSDCDADAIAVNASTTCNVTATNTTFDDITVNLQTTVNDRLRITGATGATLAGGAASATVPLAGGSPGVPSVDPGELFGYIPLGAFGVPPTA